MIGNIGSIPEPEAKAILTCSLDREYCHICCEKPSHTSANSFGCIPRDSKEQVKAFSDFGVTCSYDELLRFKKSVAFTANANMDLSGLKSEVDGMIQGVGDNFDQQICSQNGKLQTHSMALLMTQTHKCNQNVPEKLIPRLAKSDIVQQIPYDIKYSLSLLGEVNADMEDVINQATAFMYKCYSMSNTASMTEARIKVWTARIGRKATSKVPKLCSLPPTTEAFQLNVRRAHFQCAIWRRALMQEPPNLDPTEYGWFKNEVTKSLQPVTLLPTKLPAPDYILKLVCCLCSSAQPCHSSRCGCVDTSPRLHTETCMLLVFICTAMSFKQM